MYHEFGTYLDFGRNNYIESSYQCEPPKMSIQNGPVPQFFFIS